MTGLNYNYIEVGSAPFYGKMIEKLSELDFFKFNSNDYYNQIFNSWIFRNFLNYFWYKFRCPFNRHLWRETIAFNRTYFYCIACHKQIDPPENNKPKVKFRRYGNFYV